MKRYILPALALTLLASSCKLDLTPENAITYSNAFSTEAELNTTTSTIHFYLDNCMDAFTPLTKVGSLRTRRRTMGSYARAILVVSSRLPPTGNTSIV